MLDANSPGFATVSIRPRFVWGSESSLLEALTESARAGQFAWIGGGRHLTDVTYVDNVAESLILGWRRGHPGQAYFVTDQHRVVFREFMETMFDIYGVHTQPPEIDIETAEREVPVPALWFLAQECTLRTDKAVAELGYRPIVSHAEGLATTRKWAAAAR